MCSLEFGFLKFFCNFFFEDFNHKRCALGAQWTVNSAQRAVFLILLLVKLESCNCVCRLESKFHKHFCKLFLKIKVCIGCTLGFRQRTVSCFSNFFVCEARQL